MVGFRGKIKELKVISFIISKVLICALYTDMFFK